MSPPSRAKVLGVGEIILDHIWDTGSGNTGRIHSSRGGGSVFNVLATLAQLGWSATAGGVTGADRAGRYAIEDLAGLGVNTTGVRFVEKRWTRLIFELLGVDSATQVGGTSHSFTTSCPVCSQRIADNVRPSLRLTDLPAANSGLAVFDQLTGPRVAHAQQLRNAGLTNVLDLGAVGYLRYQPTAKIVAHLRHFDLVFLNGKVAESLARRTESTMMDLAELLPSTLLVITQGQHGALVTAAGGFRHRVPAPHVALLVDDSGAGDALGAHTIDHIFKNAQISTSGFAWDPRDLVEAVEAAEHEVGSALSMVGARGHLPPAPADAHFGSLRDRTGRDLQAVTWATGRCALCDLPIKTDAPDGWRRAQRLRLAASSRSPMLELDGVESTPDRNKSSQSSTIAGRRWSSSVNDDSSDKADGKATILEPYRDGADPQYASRSGALPADASLGSETQHGFNVQAATPNSRRKVNPSAKHNTTWLLNRMLATIEHPTAVSTATDILFGPKHRIQVVGSGGSGPASNYVATILNNHGHFAVATTPGDYLTEDVYADTVVIVSYSGSSRDLGVVAVNAKRRDVSRIVLVTGSQTPSIARELRLVSHDVVLSYAPPGRRGVDRPVRERGFVSIAGTVSPCVPWLAASSGLGAVIDLVERLAIANGAATAAAQSLSSAASRAGRLHVIYGPAGRPAALDIESKFTESGLPGVSLHEQKDLSHGRFMTVLNPVHGTEGLRAPVLMVTAGATTGYQRAIGRALDESGVVWASLRSTDTSIAAPLELLTAVQWFSQRVGADLDVDISRPASIPEAGLRLYKWSGPIP